MVPQDPLVHIFGGHESVCARNPGIHLVLEVLEISCALRFRRPQAVQGSRALITLVCSMIQLRVTIKSDITEYGCVPGYLYIKMFKNLSNI